MPTTTVEPTTAPAPADALTVHSTSNFFDDNPSVTYKGADIPEQVIIYYYAATDKYKVINGQFNMKYDPTVLAFKEASNTDDDDAPTVCPVAKSVQCNFTAGEGGHIQIDRMLRVNHQAFGGQLFVNNATAIARAVGVSDKFIAITLLAGGTSFPELATCIVAAAKKKDQLALGNVLGSNVFNILLILGTSAVVTPLSTLALTWVDLGVLLASAALIWLWTYTGHRDRIDRWEAILMLLLFFGYYTWLFVKL